jgi:hypothetical protein
VRSKGFATTSHAPKFRASAQRRSSASLDATINDGAFGRALICSSTSIHVPGSKSRSQRTTAISCCCNKVRVDARSRALKSIHFVLPMMTWRDKWSSSRGLTERTVSVPVVREPQTRVSRRSKSAGTGACLPRPDTRTWPICPAAPAGCWCATTRARRRSAGDAHRPRSNLAARRTARCRLRGNVDRRNQARFSFLIAVRSWIAALKGLASEIRFRPSRHSLNAAVDLDEHEAHVVAETPKTQEKVSGFVERMQAEERSATVAPN